MNNPTLIRDPWRRAWHFLGGDIFLALVITLLTLLLIAATLLPQTPQNDPIAYSRWLSEAQQRFDNLTGLFTTLGLFSIFNSVVFRLALGLLGLVSALRLIDQIDQLRARLAFPDRPTHPAVESALDLNLDQVRSNLSGYRIRSQDDLVMADRLPRSAIAGLTIYGGILIVLLGLLIGSFSDHRVDGIDIDLGQQAAVNGTPYSARLDSLTPNFDQATITLLDRDKTIAHGAIGSASPSIGSGSAVYLDRIGPAVIISATDETGRSIGLQSTADSPSQTEKLISFNRDHPEGFVAAPDAGIVLQIEPQSISSAGSYVVRAYQTASGKILSDGTIAAGESLTVNQTTFQFQPSAFITVSIVDQPSHYPIALGALGIVLGLIGWMIWPPRRVWLQAAGDQTHLISDDPDFDAKHLGSIGLGTWRSIWIMFAIWASITLVTGVLIGMAYHRSASIAAVDPALIGCWLAFSGSLIVHRRARIILLAIGVLAGLIALIHFI